METEPVSEMVQAVAPAVLWSSLKFGSITGLGGLAFGGTAGVIRSKTPLLFSIASGIQCFTLGTTFWAVRQSLLLSQARKRASVINDVPTRQRKQASAMAGAASGAVTAVIFRGRSSIIPGAIMFSLFGFLGQSTIDLYEQQHEATEAGQQRLGLVQQALRSRYSPVKLLTDEEYGEMLNEKLVGIEADIALIDEQLDELNKQQQPTLSEDRKP